MNKHVSALMKLMSQRGKQTTDKIIICHTLDRGQGYEEEIKQEETYGMWVGMG